MRLFGCLAALSCPNTSLWSLSGAWIGSWVVDQPRNRAKRADLLARWVTMLSTDGDPLTHSEFLLGFVYDSTQRV